MFNQNSCTQVKNPTGELGKQGKHGSHASSVTIYAFGLEKRCHVLIDCLKQVKWSGSGDISWSSTKRQKNSMALHSLGTYSRFVLFLKYEQPLK